MNITEAKVICDSVSPAGKRITTLQLKYPRIIHGEMMTHRVFSRNASSSRAIPVEKMITDVRKSMFVPEYWGKNQSGMQADMCISEKEEDKARSCWLAAAEDALYHAWKLSEIGVHKQLANRLLEPFQYIRVLVTSTEWDNFFELRDHEDAQPEIQHLAKLMRKAIDESRPSSSEWHLPYIDCEEAFDLYDFHNYSFKDFAKISAARCCRVSYLKHNGTRPNADDDLKLFDRLVGSKPLHASPLEHQAIALKHPEGHSRNFVGWQQFREMYEESLK